MKVKLHLSLILLLILSMLLTACSASAATTASTTAANTTASSSTKAAASSGDKITIKYWTTNRHDQAYLTPLIEKYNKTNTKNIFVDYQVYADNFSQMLDLAFSTNDAPDVYQNITDVYTSVEKNRVLDLAPFMDDAYKARFGANAFVEGVNSIGNKIYSLPYTASAARLFYNQDIFDKVGIAGPPTTMDELVKDATLVSEKLGKEGIYGFSANLKSPMSSVMRFVDTVVMRSGGTRGGFDFKTGKYDFSSYKPVIEAYKKIFTSDAAFPGSESLDIDPLRTQFAAGKLAMYISVSHAEPGVYANQFPTTINWNCAPLPTVNGKIEGKQALWFGGNFLAISSTTKHPEEAWDFVKFMHSDEVMGGYYSAGLGTVMIESAIKGVATPATITKMPNLALDVNDSIWPPLPAGLTIEGKDYASTFIEAMFGVVDIDKAIADLNTRYNAAYDKKLAAGGTRIVYPNFDPLTLNTK